MISNAKARSILGDKYSPSDEVLSQWLLELGELGIYAIKHYKSTEPKGLMKDDAS